MARTFSWKTSPQSGLWNVPANWTDVTDGTTGVLAPGAGDAVSLPGGAGTVFQIVGGPGSAGSLTAYGNNALVGAITVGTLTIGSATATGAPAGLDNSDALDLEPGAVLRATTGATLYSNLELDGGNLLSSGGVDVLSGANDLASGTVSDDVVVVNGSLLDAATEMTLAAGDLIEDGTAAVEVGTAGGAAAGVVTVDAGGVLTLSGVFTLVEQVTDNGDMVISNTSTPGVSLDRAVTGTGAFDTATNAVASITNASVSGLSRFHLGQGSKVTFLNGTVSSVGTVVLDTGSSLVTGALSNDGPVTLAANASLSAGNVSGSSTITAGSGAALTISGTLSGLSGVSMGNSAVLTLSGAGDTNVPINLGSNGNVALNLSAGADIGGAVSGFDSSDLIENRPTASNTSIIDRVTFTPGTGGGPGTLSLLSGTTVVTTVALSGNYGGQTFLTNFTGITYGDSDITLPGALLNGIGPGSQTVTGSAYRLFTLVTGGGSSGALTMTANLALQGAYAASSLSLVASANGTDDTTDILANSSLAVAGNANIATNLQLTDTGSRLTVGGLLTLGGASASEPQVILAETSGLRAANLTISGATGSTTLGSNTVPELAVLGNSTVELGTGSLATAGSIAIDPGATLTLAIDGGEVVAGTVIDDGSITMAQSAQGVALGGLNSSIHLASAITGTGSVLANGTMLVDGTVSGVALSSTGTLTVDGNVSGLQTLTLGASSTTSLQGLSYSQALEVGASASLSVGGLAGAGVLTGLASLTLDNGASATFTGTVSTVGAITVGSSGSIEFDKGGSGSGAITLGNSDTLKLVSGAITGWSGVSLGGQDVISTFGSGISVPAISGFDTSDKIQLTTSTFDSAAPGLYYTGATWVQNTATSGTLTLTEDGQAVQSYTLMGSYSASQFVTYAGNNVLGTGVGSSGLTLAFGTQAGLNGAALTGSTGGSFLLLTGAGTQSALTITNNVAVAGAFSLGSVQFNATGSAANTNDAVVVEAGGSISASSATINDVVEVDGAGASLTVAGSVAFSNSTGDNALLAYNGASVQVGGTSTATEYDFDAVQFAVDATGSLEVGHAGGAAAGTLTVDAGSVLHTSSGVDIAADGGMVLNGTWTADNAASNVGGFGAGISSDYLWHTAITGSGALQIAADTFVATPGSISGLSSVTATGGGGLSVAGGLLGIGTVSVGAGSSIGLSGVGTDNFSAGVLTLADATSSGNRASFSVQNNATGTGALSVGAYDVFTAGGTVSGWTQITAGANAQLSFGGAEQASPITLGAGALLVMGVGATISGVISGFGHSNYIDYAFSTTTGKPIITAASWTAGSGGLGTLTLSDDGNVVTQLTLAGNYSGDDFLTNFAGESGNTTITLADPPCYCPGTLIRTDQGEVPVESLAEGDWVVTVAGALRPVVWIGRRSYAARFVRRARTLHPVCIKAGAFAPAIPAHDLWVSPQHAVFLDGVLIPAHCLINGTTVVQPVADDDVHYLHVELPEHDVIWANGLAAESFVDDDSRGLFHNAGEYARRYPNAAAPGGYCARRVESGPELDAVRQRLDNADVQDVALAAEGSHRIAVCNGAAAVRLLTTFGHARGDARRLGAAVSRIVVDGAEVPLDGDQLATGWHRCEGSWRWTNGAALLLAPGAKQVEVTIASLPFAAAA